MITDIASLLRACQRRVLYLDLMLGLEHEGLLPWLKATLGESVANGRLRRLHTVEGWAYECDGVDIDAVHFRREHQTRAEKAHAG